MALLLPPAWPQIALQRGLSLLLEAPCLGCGAPAADPLCHGCEVRLDPLPDRRCRRCQGGLDVAERCSLCGPGRPPFRRVVALGSYSGLLRQLLKALKYRARVDLGLWLGDRLAPRLGANRWDLVVPIPVHPRRRRERGYNQAEPIAWQLARHLGCALETRVLVRPQTALPFYQQNRTDRWRDAQQAFAVRPERVKGRRLLVVDDIMTSGATLWSAAALLEKAGARRIDLAVIARAHRP